MITSLVSGDKFNTMKKSTFLALLLLLFFCAGAQHYYKDILTVEAANQRHQLHRLHKVKSIRFLSFDAENQAIEGFSSEQNFSRDFLEVTTRTNTTLTGPTESISWFNVAGQLVKTLDTSDGVKTIVQYSYNEKGWLKNLVNTTSSPGGFVIKETHEWEYNSNGKPIRMLRIKNDKDTTFLEFVSDEKGNIAEEKSKHRGKDLPTIYYYYNEDNRLTDIVRYNQAARRLLPDYIFEYDEKNRLGSMLVVPEGSSDYQKWYYSYDEDGLKILDACYSKTKVLIARVEYQYTYY